MCWSLCGHAVTQASVCPDTAAVRQVVADAHREALAGALAAHNSRVWVPGLYGYAIWQTPTK